MLEITVIGVLLCVIGIQEVRASRQRSRIRALLQQLQNLGKHADSWKLAAEFWEKKANDW